MGFSLTWKRKINKWTDRNQHGLGRRTLYDWTRNKVQIFQSFCSGAVTLVPIICFGKKKKCTSRKESKRSHQEQQQSFKSMFQWNRPLWFVMWYLHQSHRVLCKSVTYSNIPDTRKPPLPLLHGEVEVHFVHLCLVCDALNTVLLSNFWKKAPISHQIYIKHILTKRNDNPSHWVSCRKVFFVFLGQPKNV